jgi:hypothetical protein
MAFCQMVFNLIGRMFGIRSVLKKKRPSFGQYTIMPWQLILGATASSRGSLPLAQAVIQTSQRLSFMHSMIAHRYNRFGILRPLLSTEPPLTLFRLNLGPVLLGINVFSINPFQPDLVTYRMCGR